MAKKLCFVITLMLTLICVLTSCGHEHEYGEWETIQTPTCTAEGEKERYCSCGEKQTQTIAKTEHSYGEWSIQNATCTAEGMKTRTCSCGEKQTQTIAKTEHSYGEWETVQNPTCTEVGEKERSCSCGEKQTDSIPKTEHSYGEWETVQNPTCTEVGEKERSCSCGEKQTQTVAKTEHTYGEWVVVRSSCTETGLKEKTCSCGAKIQESIPAGHNYVNGKCSKCSNYDIADVLIFYVYDEYDTNTDTYNLYVSFFDSNNNRIAVDFTGTFVINDNFNNVLYEKAITATEADFAVYPTQHSGDVVAHKVSVSRQALLPASSELGYITYTVNYQNDGTKSARSTLTNLVLTPFTPLTYSGTGDRVISNLNLPAGAYNITLTHNGKSNFITKLYYGSQSYDYQILTNEIGKYEGSHALYEHDGKPIQNGSLQVLADGSWTIKIERIEDTCTTKIKGYGDTVTGSFIATEERYVVSLSHVGKSNFIVMVIDKTSGKCNYATLTNEIGNYTGEKILNLTVGHEYFVYVRADGEWTIDFGLNDELTDYTESSGVAGNTPTTALNKLKNYIIANGTYSASNDTYKWEFFVDYSSNYTSQYTHYLTYDVADDKIIWNFLSHSASLTSLVSIYFDGEVDGSYTYVYVDSSNYQMGGILTASTFTSNTLVGYSYQNISNATLRAQIRELASIGVRLILTSVEIYAGPAVGFSIRDFGFTALLS